MPCCCLELLQFSFPLPCQIPPQGHSASSSVQQDSMSKKSCTDGDWRERRPHSAPPPAPWRKRRGEERDRRYIPFAGTRSSSVDCQLSASDGYYLISAAGSDRSTCRPPPTNTLSRPAVKYARRRQSEGKNTATSTSAEGRTANSDRPAAATVSQRGETVGTTQRQHYSTVHRYDRRSSTAALL